MAVGGGVNILEAATRLQEANLGSASDMVVEKGARLKAALVVLKDGQACAFHMVVGADASTQDVTRELKEALCSARLMVEESVAYLQGVLRVLKGALHCAKDTEGESAACLMVVAFAQKVYMEEQAFVWPMVVERDVQCQDARKVHVAVLIVVLGMGEGSGVNLKAVVRVLKGAQTSARPMVEVSDAAGEEGNVRSLLEARTVFVLHIAAWPNNRS